VQNNTASVTSLLGGGADSTGAGIARRLGIFPSYMSNTYYHLSYCTPYLLTMGLLKPFPDWMGMPVFMCSTENRIKYNTGMQYSKEQSNA